MNITLYRYKARAPLWDTSSVSKESLQKLADNMNDLPFQGEESDRKFGFAHCDTQDNIAYGLFIQKFPKKLTDYDAQTKEESKQVLPDSGEYLFLFFPKKYEFYIQTKRSADLPSQDQIIKRFIAAFKLAVGNGSFLFTALDVTHDEVDRQRIIDIFYNEADKITEIELEDFDRDLVEEEKAKRGGKFQTYFNPIDEYQPAMELASKRLGNNADKVIIKAKSGESLKKDPIARAALEASRRPVKITYSKNSEVFTERGVTKSKEELTLEGSNFDLNTQFESIMSQLTERATPSPRPPQNSNQTSLIP